MITSKSKVVQRMLINDQIYGWLLGNLETYAKYHGKINGPRDSAVLKDQTQNIWVIWSQIEFEKLGIKNVENN